MATIRAYTTIEQSKKLADILPVESADMGYLWNGTSFCDYPVSNQTIFKRVENVPCWSLAALLNVLPQTVRLVGTSKDSYWYCECVNANNQWYAGFESASNPVDAAYEMIIKLNELNLL